MTTTSVTPLPGLSMSELRFAAGVPGFPQARAFTLKSWGAEPSPFIVLECQDVIGLRFVAVGPALFFPWYEPHFGPEVYQALDAGGPGDIAVLVILTLHARPEDTTANLLGPLAINTQTGQAVQAVLSGCGYEPQTPIVSKR